MAIRLFRFSSLLALLTLVTGCKLGVIVVEGGEVQSVSSGTCLAGTVCIHEVTDTNYSETFTAVPDPGWTFVKWNTGEGFHCKDSTSATCVASNVGTGGIAPIEALVASDTTFYLMPIFNFVGSPITSADTIIVADKEWAQVDLFISLSWNQINVVCPAGLCAGELNGYDVTGWRWATLEEVGGLFHATTPHPGGMAEYVVDFGDNQPLIDFFLVQGFRPTSVEYVAGFPDVVLAREIKGYASAPTVNISGPGALLSHYSFIPGEAWGRADTLELGLGGTTSGVATAIRGAWLYRPVTP